MTKLKALPKRIQISKDMRMSIEKHAYSNLTAEVGGMLFGEILGGKTQVVGSIPATSAAAEQISLTFTHEVWEQILAEGNKLFPGKQIVGWYHTHPSFGLFMSDYDQFIQKNFFQNNGQIGLVIDPIAGNQGWFEVNAKGDVAQFATEETFTGPKAAPKEKPVAKPSKGRLVAALLMGTVIGGVLGWGIFTTTTDAVPAATFAQAQAQIASQQAEIQDASAALNTLCVETNRLRVAASHGLLKELFGCVPSKQGDTWASISLTYFGNDKLAPLIKASNPEVVTADIPAGTVISFPAQDAITAFMAPKPTPSPTAAATPKPTPKPTPSSKN